MLIKSVQVMVVMPYPDVPFKKDETSDSAVGELLVMLGWKRRGSQRLGWSVPTGA